MEDEDLTLAWPFAPLIARCRSVTVIGLVFVCGLGLVCLGLYKKLIWAVMDF